MKTKTSVSLSSDARSLLTAASEDIGVSKSAVLEIAIREYAYQRSVTTATHLEAIEEQMRLLGMEPEDDL